MSERIVMGALLAVTLAKVWAATAVPLLGDEAFYRWESLRPALGYSDLPPMTAWVLALTRADGLGYLGVRWFFVALGLLQVVLVFVLARRVGTRREAFLAAGLSIGVPLLAIQGLLAGPDVLLNVLALCLAITLVDALRGHRRAWVLAGLVGMLGLATHLRFGVPLFGGLVAVLLTRAGRAAIRTDRRTWIAAGLAVCGLLPSLLFDLRHDFAALGFQLAERHPWQFQAEALAQPLVQAIVTVPLLYVVLLAAAVAALRRWRGDDPAWAVVAAGGVVPPLLYFAVGLFADQERVGFHWPAPGYLVLCAAAPLVLHGRLLRRLAQWGWGLGVAVTVVLFLGLALIARQPHATGGMKGLLPVNAIGWPEVAGYVPRGSGTLVADNFLLAAELAFELGRDDVYVLDHPRNQEHGRAVQLAVWGLDEASLPPGPGVVVVEDTAVKPAERPRQARRICERFPDARPLVSFQLLEGSKRFRLLEFGRGTGTCDHPAFGYIDVPPSGAAVTAPFSLAGWVFDDDEGVAAVAVLVDGRPAADAGFGEPRPDVANYFGGSTDPDGVRSLQATVPAEPGARKVALRITSRDGGSWETRPIQIHVR